MTNAPGPIRSPNPKRSAITSEDLKAFAKRLREFALVKWLLESEATERWRALLKDIRDRVLEPFRSPSFVLYFLSVILLVGGTGVWVSIYKATSQEGASWVPVYHDLATYAIAVAAGAFCDVLLSRDATLLQSFRMFSLALLFLSLFLGLLSLVSHAVPMVPCVSLGSAFASLFLWWIATSRDARLKDDQPDPEASTGGDPEAQLPGTLSGIINE